MADQQKQTNTVSFRDTLNLPQTTFAIRPQSAIDDPQMIERWQKEGLYEKAMIANKNGKKFILHDGPPYANGNIHIGHAYNKVLKDIVTKYHRMKGYQVPVIPGWDCHGLPIEIKVSKENPNLSKKELIKACRDYAAQWIEIQKSEFKRLGVVMDWQHPYATMDYSYEAATIQAFGIFVGQEYIERKYKTVAWCPVDQTVLAAAEIEYEERKDPSIYVLFKLDENIQSNLFKDVALPIYFLVWTTTPWTLPLNRAVLLNPEARYAGFVVNDRVYVVAKQRVEAIAQMLQVEPTILFEFDPQLLSAGASVYHPLIQDFQVPLLLDSSVQLNEGTAAVHCAPGAGPQDYEVGVKNNLEIFGPVGPDGKYQFGIKPEELVGMSVADGNIWVIKKLVELDTLAHKTSIRHQYPHCWRCHNGLIFRATKQWFFNLEKNNLKQTVLKAVDGIDTIPEKSIARLKATIESRFEWCLSRQRAWGTPIPALICTSCDYVYTNKEFIDKVAAQVAQKGIEYWQEVDAKSLYPTSDFSCPTCAKTDFVKEQDILDVWFDAGVSHFAVLLKRQGQAFPADVYLEGKDQHRGWFQSSLLTSMVLEQEPCMKTIMTHGFTVDAQGKKMSKSVGNVVSPAQMMEKLGTDGLRLWAASIDCADDAVVSDILITNVQEVFRKIRNTGRFLLSNLYDYDHTKNAVAFDKLKTIDRHALAELIELQNVVVKAYEEYDFTKVFHVLGDYCANNLSAFYLDISKDRLYVEQADGHARRSAQTAYYIILDALTRLMAPILSFTAEQISDLYQKNKKESIHLQSFADLSALGETQKDFHVWKFIKEIRSVILKAIERKREQQLIKHSLEAQVRIFIDNESQLAQALHPFFAHLECSKESVESFFKELMIVSQVDVVSNAQGLEQTEVPGLFIVVEHAQGEKCPRCWQWSKSTHPHHLCDRCYKVLKNQGNSEI